MLAVSCIIVFQGILAVQSSCSSEYGYGEVCGSKCCSIENELILLNRTREAFQKHTTHVIEEMLEHNYPDEIFHDLFFPDTPRYAVPAQIKILAQYGHFDNEQVINYELERKMRTLSFATEKCKKIDFVAKYLAATTVEWEKDHAIYMALLVADEIKKEILSFPLSDNCINDVAKNMLIQDYSCDTCKGDKPMARTCTNLCENVVNGCYYILSRVFAHHYQSYKDNLVVLLKERSQKERAKYRHDIAWYLTEQDIVDGMTCSGLPRYEVEFRMERLLDVPQLGRNRYLTNTFRLFLRSPEIVVHQLLPIQPNANSICRNKGHLTGNSDCFNGLNIGKYTETVHSTTFTGQEGNKFKSFGGTVVDFTRLDKLGKEIVKVTKELMYQAGRED